MLDVVNTDQSVMAPTKMDIFTNANVFPKMLPVCLRLHISFCSFKLHSVLKLIPKKHLLDQTIYFPCCESVLLAEAGRFLW